MMMMDDGGGATFGELCTLASGRDVLCLCLNVSGADNRECLGVCTSISLHAQRL